MQSTSKFYVDPQTGASYWSTHQLPANYFSTQVQPFGQTVDGQVIQDAETDLLNGKYGEDLKPGQMIENIQTVLHQCILKQIGKELGQVQGAERLKERDEDDELIWQFIDFKVRDEILLAQRACVLHLLKCAFPDVDPDEAKKETISEHHTKCQEIMTKVNAMNWQYSVNHFQPKQDECQSNYLPDFECIEIQHRLAEIKKDASTDKYIKQDALGLKANLYSMTVVNQNGQVKFLMPNPENDRMQRRRPNLDSKSSSMVIHDTTGEGTGLAKKFGEFGCQWALEFKGEQTGMPTLNDILEGLLNWLTKQTTDAIINRIPESHKEQENARIRIVKNSRKNFQVIFDAIEFTAEQMQEKMTKDFRDPFKDPVLNLYNPYSKATCLILYLYSLELGQPPLYAEINRCAREMDLKYLADFGPYIKALNLITAIAEAMKDKKDRIKPGIDIGGLDRNLSGTFLLFRGAPMMNDWITPYENAVKRKYIRLPGSNSCTSKLKVGLGFAFEQQGIDDMIPTLFVIICQNYRGINGIFMNNEAYTAYPSESEVLLSEGCKMFVLAVDRGVKINNSTDGVISTYNGKEVTIIHMLHPQ